MAWIIGVQVFAFFIVLLNAQVLHLKFSCKGRPSGYYADIESGCQVYHMCDGLGRQFSYSCPNATLFQQRMLICDHWYMVNCSKSEDDYSANLLIGQREKPFVDDSDSHPYHRTPRPDLLSHPSDTEYNIIYRTSRARKTPNLVGAESEEGSTSSTDQPAYNLPSHWSTEYSQHSTTVRSAPAPQPKSIDFNNRNNNIDDFSNAKRKQRPRPTGQTIRVNYKSNFKATTPVYPQTVELTSVAPDSLGILPPNGENHIESEEIPQKPIVNFQSNFKATTPVYPLTVESTSIAPDNLGILPPNSAEETDKKPIENSIVNFISNFKATTPVYPQSVESTSLSPDILGILPPISNINQFQPPQGLPIINFQSNFQATTPVYPQSVEATSPEPGDLGLLPPLTINDQLKPVQDTLPSSIIVNRNANEILPPSLLYQPPKVEPNYKKILQLVADNKNNLEKFKTEHWDDLRKKFLIPDYEFPLDSASRPSYDSSLSSFQVQDQTKNK